MRQDGSFRFDPFLLDCGERRLTRNGEPVAINARYLDALILLVRERGRLVSKDRFLDEVWRGVPVTDEALTQCVRTLRRQLGDDVGSPRFIETVPKHGYRFVAPVAVDAAPAIDDAPVPRPKASPIPPIPWASAAAGATGALVAGAIGGLLYGFAAASQPGGAAMGAASILLVLTSVTVLLALLGGAGVSIGIALTEGNGARVSPLAIAGGAAGGLVVGALAKLLGLDAFALLLGHAPAGVTGAAEGAALGAAAGLGCWLASLGARPAGRRRAAALGALCGGVAGVAIVAAGGRLLGGSLDLLARTMPGARLRLDALGRLFGEDGFGATSQLVTGGLEGALFVGCLVAAITRARARLPAPSRDATIAR